MVARPRYHKRKRSRKAALSFGPTQLPQRVSVSCRLWASRLASGDACPASRRGKVRIAPYYWLSSSVPSTDGH